MSRRPETIRFIVRRFDTGDETTLEVRWAALERALAQAGYALVPLPERGAENGDA